ncbi:MAG: prealbumin-like fold domain-containing protein [Mediterraneibacter faecis]
MKDATYGVYSEKSLSGASKVGTLITDANGDSNTLTLTAGTYYVKEVTAPKGYALDKPLIR